MRRLLVATYLTLLVVMAAATFVEAAHGTPYAHRHIYGTWWFIALWVVMAVAGIGWYKTYFRPVPRKEKWPWGKGVRLLLHSAFLVILAGALLTHILGRSGTIHLRMRQPQCFATIDDNGQHHLQRLDFALELTDCQVIKTAHSQPTDYRAAFRIRNLDEVMEERLRGTSHPSVAEGKAVSPNHIATYRGTRFCLMGCDSDGQGITLRFNRDPWGIPVTYVGYALFLVAFGCTLLRRLRYSRLLFVALLPAALWCVHYFLLDGSWAEIPILRTPLLFVHVAVIILSYSLLLVQAARSVMCLVRRRPEVDTTLLQLALFLLATGIVLGAVWANISWGSYWSWDAKEVWALLTLMVYAIPLHHRCFPLFARPRVFHAYAAVAFTLVLITYFGAGYLFTGMHSYK